MIAGKVPEVQRCELKDREGPRSWLPSGVGRHARALEIEPRSVDAAV